VKIQLWQCVTVSATSEGGRVPWVPGFKRGPGCQRTNWRSTVNKDLLRMGITWEEVEVAAKNRSEWHRCIVLNRGQGS